MGRRFWRAGSKLLAFSFLGALIFALRYILKTPQPLESALPGEARLYKWTRGHIFYKMFGESDAPPIVLLHRLEPGASSYEMRALMQELATQYRVYAPDLLGFGLSDHPDIHYAASIYTSLIRDFLVEVVGRPATVLARGMSCQHAIAVAASEPNLCSALVLLPPAKLLQPEQAEPQLAAWVAPIASHSLTGLMLYALITPRAVLRRVVAGQRGISAQAMSEEELDALFAAAHQFGAQRATLALLSGQLDLDVTRQLGTLQQPTLFIWGTSSLDPSHSLLSQHPLPERAQVVLMEDSQHPVQEQWAASVVAHMRGWQHEAEAVPVSSSLVAPLLHTEETEAPASLTTSDISSAATEAATATSSTPSQPTAAASTAEVVAYCVKCKQKRSILNPQSVVTKNGRRALAGTCPVCATKLFRFISDKKEEAG